MGDKFKITSGVLTEESDFLEKQKSNHFFKIASLPLIEKAEVYWSISILTSKDLGSGFSCEDSKTWEFPVCVTFATFFQLIWLGGRCLLPEVSVENQIWGVVLGCQQKNRKRVGISTQRYGILISVHEIFDFQWVGLMQLAYSHHYE